MLKLSNKEVVFISRWLTMPLHGEEARARNKFIKIISPQKDACEETRLEVINELAEKDEAGKPVLENGMFKFSEENKKEFNSKYGSFLEEETEYEIDGANKNILKNIYNVLSTKLTRGMDIDEGSIYDEVMLKFEVALK